ncbi:hypothetical protein [Streptomyces luteolifulvus]|uniref:hypothetical protein n=1 Tax=Streptomyces luteolifulvus TaxID=2615112 RepID=UPI0017827CAE|nr:hypothetical protein [Streptomyces luteolifulvus]
MTFVLVAMVLGGFAGVALTERLADASFLSAVIPEDGRGSLVIGGIGLGALTGILLPLILLGLFRGTSKTTRLRPPEAWLKLLGLLVFDVYLLVVAVVVSQLGWALPEGLTRLISVFAIGFSWIPLAVIPWEKFWLTSNIGKQFTRRSKTHGSHEPD